MADVPADVMDRAAQAAAEACAGLAFPPTQIAVRRAIEAAAPVLAEAVAAKITEHAERQRPRLPGRLPDAWHRHFSIAARVAAGAFTTDEERKREVAQALNRGDFIACDIPEVPGEH